MVFGGSLFHSGVVLGKNEYSCFIIDFGKWENVWKFD